MSEDCFDYLLGTNKVFENKKKHIYKTILADQEFHEPRSLYHTLVMSSPSLSPSSVHLAFDARSWGAVHIPPVQVLNCRPPTHRRCPSVHVALLTAEAVLDGLAVDDVAALKLKGCQFGY